MLFCIGICARIRISRKWKQCAYHAPAFEQIKIIMERSFAWKSLISQRMYLQGDNFKAQEKDAANWFFHPPISFPTEFCNGIILLVQFLLGPDWVSLLFQSVHQLHLVVVSALWFSLQNLVEHLDFHISCGCASAVLCDSKSSGGIIQFEFRLFLRRMRSTSLPFSIIHSSHKTRNRYVYFRAKIVTLSSWR